MKQQNLRERVKSIIHDPNLHKPISELRKEYKGDVKLITKIRCGN